MLNKYCIASYVIVFGLTIVFFSPVIGCAQSEGNKLISKVQSEKKPGQKINQTTKNVKLQPQLSTPRDFSRQNTALTAAIKGLQAVLKKKDTQINKLNQKMKSLQAAAQDDLAKTKKAQVEKDKKINGLNIAIKSIQDVVKKKDTQLVALNTAIKSLQAVVAKKETELVALDTELVEVDTELVSLDKELVAQDTKLIAIKAAINCYKKALSTWDDLHLQATLTEQKLLYIDTELRRSIVACPGI